MLSISEPVFFFFQGTDLMVTVQALKNRIRHTSVKRLSDLLTADIFISCQNLQDIHVQSSLRICCFLLPFPEGILALSFQLSQMSQANKVALTSYEPNIPIRDKFLT